MPGLSPAVLHILLLSAGDNPVNVSPVDVLQLQRCCWICHMGFCPELAVLDSTLCSTQQNQPLMSKIHLSKIIRNNMHP